GVEVERQSVLELGCVVPDFVLSTLQPKQSGQLRLSNQRDSLFEGTLEIAAPAGMTLLPARSGVRLPPNGQTTIALEAGLAANAVAGAHTFRVRLIDKEGKVELARTGKIEHLGKRGRVTLRPIEDSYVSQRYPSQNKAASTDLVVDGGDRKMGDVDHSLAYLKFRLDVPGKPVAARLRLYNAGNPSGNAGRVCLAQGAWQESAVTYANRPQPGKELARLGAVGEREVVERPIAVEHLIGRELSLVIDPTSCDGVDYLSRESDKPPELIVEYELP
ncbi:MAG: DNRLRE domain-containing protein, partial [Thermoguttaceae bacterium]|nr:DNRLRE domain-containing protein [Thermoguttaceae bacterium]